MNPNSVEWLDLGVIDYDEAFFIQQKLHEECWRGLRPDVVIFQQNEPVITCGIDADPSHILWSEHRLREVGIKVKKVGRGGGVAYHGPGQLVISPVLHFLRYRETAHLYLRSLEDVIIFLLGRQGVEGRRIEGKSGVFVGNDKVAAVGLACSHSVTMHGMSLNIRPNMRHYEAIIACGLWDVGVTSLEALGHQVPSYEKIRDEWLVAFSTVFGLRPEPLKSKNYPKL